MRRLVARTMAKQIAKKAEKATAKFQCALTTEAGCECVAHILRTIRTRMNEQQWCPSMGDVLFFVGIQTSFLAYKRQRAFGGPKSLYMGHRRFVWDTSSLFMTFSEVKGGLINCKIVVDILEGQKRQG